MPYQPSFNLIVIVCIEQDFLQALMKIVFLDQNLGNRYGNGICKGTARPLNHKALSEHPYSCLASVASELTEAKTIGPLGPYSTDHDF